MQIPTNPIPESPKQLFGLGGWLIVVQCHLWLSAIIGIWNLIEYGSSGTFIVLILMILYMICLVMFYRRNIRFRSVYIAAVAIEFLPMLIRTLIGYENGILMVIAGALYTLIIRGLFVSERVRNTFHQPGGMGDFNTPLPVADDTPTDQRLP